MKISLVVNDHFEEFIHDWKSLNYFLVGGYGSSKSYHAATKLVLKAMEEKRTIMVARAVFETLRESCFSLLKEVINNLGLTKQQVSITTSPMQITFINGSRIIFRGGDDPEKLKSIHNVSIIWIEECSEIAEPVFKELKGRLRHPTLSMHMILTTNPVSKDNWCYRYFFMDQNKGHFILNDEELYEKRVIVRHDTYYHHSVADDNKFLPKAYIDNLEGFKSYDPDMYRVAREGKFGISGVRVFPQFETMGHEDIKKKIQKIEHPIRKCGMDFGFSESYNALIQMVIDPKENTLYIDHEYYTRGKTDPEIAEDISDFAYRKVKIVADSAEPKTIQYFKSVGFNMRPARKFKGSRLQYTKKVKRFKKIIVSNNCPNTIQELQYLTFKKDRSGNIIEDEFSIDPHTLSAIWYGLDDYNHTSLKGDNQLLTKSIFGL